MRPVRRLAVLFVFVVLIVSWVVGSRMVPSHHRPIGSPPEELGAEEVSLDSDPGITIRGWFVKGGPGKGAVLLLHGIGASRLMMAPRASFLKRLGYSVLLIDLRAHGESGGEQISLGLNEAHDASAALDFLRRRLPGEKIAAIGVSLGGAALLLADPPLKLDAVVLESVFPRIEKAIENRVRMQIGGIAGAAKYLLLWQIPFRLHVLPSAIRPIDHIAAIGAPVFVIAGTDDIHTTLDESKELCARAVSPKQCWWVEGAAHVDLFGYAGADYERRVSDFLATSLR